MAIEIILVLACLLFSNYKSWRIGRLHGIDDTLEGLRTQGLLDWS